MDVWDTPYFRESEFASPDTGEAFMDESFMLKLIELRKACGFPLSINSGYRTPAHNAKVGGGEHSVHVEGCAADIRCRDPYTLVRLAFEKGFAGIGIMQHGDHERRYVHLDTGKAIPGIRPRPWLWSYK